ncbi:MAG: hypothetical protein ACI4EO_04045 [Blautia sp.]
MEVKVRVADPAGNITIFVTSPVERALYPRVANALLEVKEFHGEQVGFIEEKADGTSHMQMMGGEFCGNATRSFGYLLSMEHASKDGKPEMVEVDVSGSVDALLVEIDHEVGTSKTTMPLPEKIVDVEVPEYGTYHMVVFDGISHVIVKGPRREETFVKEVVKAAMEQYRSNAVGIMFLEPSGDGMEKRYRITPVVYVEETKSLVWESSCGSGSIATAVYLSKMKKDGTYVYVLKHPGGVIEATVVKEGEKVVQCKMGGPVSISEEKSLEINL